MPGTAKVSGSNLTRTCFFPNGKYSGSKKCRLLFVCLCFIGFVYLRIVFILLNNFHCSWFKCCSILKSGRIKICFNTGCNFTKSISQSFFFFVFFIGLISLGLIYIDLVASFCVVRGTKKFLVCSCALREKGTNDILNYFFGMKGLLRCFRLFYRIVIIKSISINHPAHLEKR